MASLRPQSRLMVLMFTDIVGSVDLKRRLGDSVAAGMIKRHDDLFRYTVCAFSFAEILKDLGDGFLARFASASDAVHAALHFQHALLAGPWEGERLKVRVGLHLGEVSELSGPNGHKAGDGEPVKISGLAVDIAARVMSLSLPGQILMTRAAFDNARQYVREHATSEGDSPGVARKWIAHGRYLFQGAEEALEVFEVGEVGVAPLRVPPDSDKARRAVAADQEETLGWRPAVGMEVPERRNWVLERKLGEGGFGEVWLAENCKTHDRRVMKFCFDAERLRSFKREFMLFRLLREALGDRQDIAKLFEVQVDKPPFYLESEFTEDGSLVDWADRQGGIEKVSQATRLDIVARTALAVSAAHSVGVLHKDIKPSNILVARGPDGQPLPRLTDFGIGALADPAQLAGRNITMVGMTESMVDGTNATRSGTRIYTPPETLMGKPFTMQGDVYALGVLLYQMVVGNLDQPLAQGWERDVADPLVREDIARCVEGHEEQRLGSAKELAERLQNLPARRRALRRRRVARVAMLSSVLLLGLLGLTAAWLVRERGLRVQTEKEARKSQEVSRFMQELLTSVDPRDSAGREVKVVDQLDRAVQRLDTGQLSAEPEVQAALRWALGNAYRALGVFDRAEAQLSAALATRREILTEPNAEIAQNLEDLGAIKWFQNDFESAEKLIRDSLSQRTRLFGEESLPVASSLNYLAACRDSLGFHQEAEDDYRRALELRRRIATGDDRVLIARSLNNLGTCLRNRQEYSEAESKFNEAVAIMKELRGPRHIDVAGGLTNIATLYMAKGELDKAETPLLEALDIKREVLGETHLSTAVTLGSLADLYSRRSDWAKAQQYAEQALAIRRTALREGHPQTLNAMDLLARSLEQQQQWTSAEALRREAYLTRVKVLPSENREIAESALRLGENLQQQQRWADAQEFFQFGYEKLKSSDERKAQAIDAGNRLLECLIALAQTQQAEVLRAELAKLSAAP